MENNFIQMAASAGHAVAYTIGPIFKLLFYKLVTKLFEVAVVVAGSVLTY